MDKDNQAQAKIPFRQKITLIIFGLFFTFIILEIGLRLGGAVFLSWQEHKNRIALERKNAYRIICLGESTTAGSYPHFLEQELNKRGIGVSFTVIDKGVPGTNTTAILNRLKADLDQYHPDMVVTMMGINDSGPHMPSELFLPDSAAAKLLKHVKTYKLARFLWLRITNRPDQAKPRPEGQYTDKLRWIDSPESGLTEEQSDKIAEVLPGNYKECVKSGWLYRNQSKIPQAEKFFKKAIELKPGSYEAYIESGWFYQSLHKFSQAEEFFRKAIEIEPKNPRPYLSLGSFYLSQGEFSKSQVSFRKAADLNPGDSRAYTELGRLYLEQDNPSRAEEFFKKAVELNPRDIRAYTELGSLYKRQGRVTQAEILLRKALKFRPENELICLELGRFCLRQGYISKAEELFKRALELNPGYDRAYIELACFYLSQGKSAQAEEVLKKGLGFFPGTAWVYTELGWFYIRQEDFSRAEEILRKAIKLHPRNDRFYGALEVLYEQKGDLKAAKIYGDKARGLRLRYYDPVTVGNYQRLKEILDRIGIKLVCVQYPMRSPEPLKKIFEGQGGVIFVDNEKIFKDALRNSGYEEYFIDAFGGDFGHCSLKGNRLLARNIADVILKEQFGK